MKKQLLSIVCLLAWMALPALAQKTVYIPNEWRNPWPSDSLLYKESDPDGKYTWSKTRSVESDNVIVFWDKNYGTKKPSESPSAYQVDEQDLLRKCEAFFDLEINKLGFVDAQQSNLAKYKVMVLLNHTTDWVCYGGGYDYQVSALWLGPSACKPVGHSVAHEVGHSFHYMCYAEHSNHSESDTDNTGFHLPCGNGQAIWEQTAQWQAAQSYPELMFDQSIGVFRKSHNLAFSHEWHRYQSYWLHYYLCQHYDDLTTVAQVWNQPMTGQTRGSANDFIQALMKLKKLNATQFFALCYDYAARVATWDLDVCKPYRQPYIGDFDYRCVSLADTAWQVALASAPQASGFNIVPLEVPEGGTTVTTHFTALPAGSKLAPGDPAEMLNGETQWKASELTTYLRPTNYARRGFRLGYVALMADGTRRYFSQDSLYCTTNKEVTASVSMTVPEGTSQLWLIVVPAPTVYVNHKWDDNPKNDDQWPYRFSLEGTRLGSRAVVYEAPVEPVIDGRPVADATITYDVYMPRRTSYEALTVDVSGRALAIVETALQMRKADISGKLTPWQTAGPAKGKMMFYSLNTKTWAFKNSGSTANGYGHWFSQSGNVTAFDSGYIYSELNPTTLSFNIGQHPARTTITEGNTYTFGQALRYHAESGETALVSFVFRLHITSGQQGYTLAETSYNDPTSSAVTLPTASPAGTTDIYSLTGQKLTSPSRRGIYIVDGRKQQIK